MIRRYYRPKIMEEYKIGGELNGHIFCFARIGCLDEDTEIYVFDNKMKKEKLKNLPDNFKVLSFNFNKNKQELKNAIKIDSGEKECFEIILDNNKKIIATSEHIFYDENNNEIKVSDLKVGNILACLKARSGMIGLKDSSETLIKKSNSLKGRVFSEKTRLSMSIAKKRTVGWMKGLTKETDERVRRASEKMRGPRSSISGDKNPMKRIEVRSKFIGRVGTMLGKYHSIETRNKMKYSHSLIENVMKNPIVKQKHLQSIKVSSKKIRESGILKGKNNPAYGKVYYPKMFYVEELNHKVRSSWEKEVCIILKENNINYEYEPKAYSVNKYETYTPDIKIMNNKFIEVKGPLFDNQIKKMKQFKEKYPDFKLILITHKINFKKLDFADVLIDYDYFIKHRNINDIIKNEI